MSTEGTELAPVVHFPPNREVVGQIYFDPDKELQERLTGLYLPEYRRELGRRSLFLSSQYRLVAEQGPGGVIKGRQGQIAKHIERALEPGAKRNNHLSRYMKKAEAKRNDREFLAFQFAVRLDPQIVARIDNDEILRQEALLPGRSRSIKAVIVYETDKILKDEQRERAIRAIREYVTGSSIAHVDHENENRLSPHSRAFTTNLQFVFPPPHHHKRTGR